MSNCQKKVTVTESVHNPYPGGPRVYTSTKNCLRKAKHFYRVTYSQLHDHRHRETKRDDIFGFCDGCNTRTALKPRFYHLDHVNSIRGVVGMVEKVDCDAAMVKDDTKKTRLDIIKSGIIRQMSQKNMRDLSPEDWREIFNSAVEEFIVSGVQNS